MRSKFSMFHKPHAIGHLFHKILKMYKRKSLKLLLLPLSVDAAHKNKEFN
jgi:hypothetical protein